jgi:uncharacterized protein (UPF0179 family)
MVREITDKLQKCLVHLQPVVAVAVEDTHRVLLVMEDLEAVHHFINQVL